MNSKIKNKQLTALGIMSGTSLDGIDFALCRFFFSANKYNFEIIKTETCEYDEYWTSQLKNAHNLNAFEFIKLHKNYGKYIGNKAQIFLQNTQTPDIIASHGHTIFHQPEINLTFQLGDGAFIAAQTNITTVSDFRNLDTALGGQGAPLVPVGDKYLFSQYDYCLNLGGFANISFDNDTNSRIAFDICPVNFVINKYAEELNQKFDKDGNIAKSGKIIPQLLIELNSDKYFAKKYPKSLAREFVEKNVYPTLKKHKAQIPDILRTYYQHIAYQITNSIKSNPEKNVLLTGGGAKNIFLTELIKQNTQSKIIIPENQIIDYKEAIIFAFLGYLRINNKTNTLKSVTGSNFDNYGGIINLI